MFYSMLALTIIKGIQICGYILLTFHIILVKLFEKSLEILHKNSRISKWLVIICILTSGFLLFALSIPWIIIIGFIIITYSSIALIKNRTQQKVNKNPYDNSFRPIPQYGKFNEVNSNTTIQETQEEIQYILKVTNSTDSTK